MKQPIKFFSLILLLIAVSFACKKRADPAPVNQGELITTVKLTLTKEGTNTPIYSVFRDLDGEGSGAPTQSDFMLDKNTKYQMKVELLDESKNPVVDITEEVEEEKEEHLLVFTPTPSSLMTIAITDRDGNNLPVGLTSDVRTGATSGSGKLKIQLRHQPPVNNQPVKNGTPGPGSDDINIDFNVMIH
jgi:hypothetical protein